MATPSQCEDARLATLVRQFHEHPVTSGAAWPEADPEPEEPKRGRPDKGRPKKALPEIVTVEALSKMELQQPKYIFEGLITGPGAWTMIGSQKAGKTLLAAQMALSYQRPIPFLDYYRTLESRGVLFVEQDDPAGLAAVKRILEKSPIPADPQKFFTVAGANFTIGLDLVAFLEPEIRGRDIGMVVLDSYTAMRPARTGGCDIVKAERNDFSLLNELAKHTGCLILILHHKSKGSAGLDWSDQGAGTYAVSMSTEGEIHLSRFRDLPITAPERLIQVRGRNCEGAELVVRFDAATLTYSFVLEGGAAQLYPHVLEIKRSFSGRTFGPKDLAQELGLARVSAHRLISRLMAAGAVLRRGYGEYVLAGGLQ